MRFRRIATVVAATALGVLTAALPAWGQPGTGGPNPPGQVPLPTCSQSSATPFPGGWLVQLYCTGGHAVSGIGSTTADAVLNGRRFGQLAQQGMRCSTTRNDIVAIPGGYIPTVTCGTRRISGVGTTATEAGASVLSFADLGRTQVRCTLSATSVQALPGGYIATFWCDGSQVSGVGNTLTSVGVNARGFALLESVFGTNCTLSPNSIAQFPGGLITTFWCGGSQISGVGSTLADAGTNALGFADVDAYGLAACTLSANSVFARSGGYVMSFWCGGRQLSGAGSTATDTGRNALGFAGYANHVGRYCTTELTSVIVRPGEFEIRFWCSGRSVTGTGPTMTAAAADALSRAPLT